MYQWPSGIGKGQTLIFQWVTFSFCIAHGLVINSFLSWTQRPVLGLPEESASMLSSVTGHLCMKSYTYLSIFIYIIYTSISISCHGDVLKNSRARTLELDNSCKTHMLTCVHAHAHAAHKPMRLHVLTHMCTHAQTMHAGTTLTHRSCTWFEIET